MKALVKFACSTMAWSQEKPLAHNLGSETPEAAISVVLYFAHCFLHLAAVQLFVTVQSVYENIIVFLLSFTLCRLCAIGVLLPVYILQVSSRLLPTVLGNIRRLFLPWHKLIEDTEAYRRQWAMQAQLQLEGKYNFRDDEIVRVDQSGKEWMNDIQWHDNTEEFLVCGARVRFVHLRPGVVDRSGSGCSPKKPIVFLHGSRSWSYMWRKIMTKLLEEGHELYALDWLGHGRSDKPTQRESVTFELHMRTLSEFVNHVQLRDAILVAHSWGGCVALCSIPHLPSSSYSGLFLVNSFLPHRPHEISRNSYLLYGVWFLLTRVVHGYVSESTITRFISPEILEGDVEGYEAPYRHLPANARPSVEHFACIGTGIPHFVLRDLRETPLWKICEAICGPRNFSYLNALALLSERDDNARGYWQMAQQNDLNVATESRPKSVVVFGERDSLVKNYKETLVRGIGKNNMVDWAPDGIWLQNAGHYPMEDKPEGVAQLIARLAVD